MKSVVAAALAVFREEVLSASPGDMQVMRDAGVDLTKLRIAEDTDSVNDGHPTRPRSEPWRKKYRAHSHESNDNMRGKNMMNYDGAVV